MKKIITITILLLFAQAAWAQLTDNVRSSTVGENTSLRVSSANSPFSLIDMSKVSWSHSYSVSFFSGSGNSFSRGLLNTTMFYEPSSKLLLAFDFGLAHNPGVLWGTSQETPTFLPGFMLDFHPSEHFNIRIDYRRFDNTNPFIYRSFDRSGLFTR